VSLLPRVTGAILALVALALWSWLTAVHVPLFLYPSLGWGVATLITQVVVSAALSALPVGFAFGRTSIDHQSGRVGSPRIAGLPLRAVSSHALVT
jgi:hypothetical protein